MASLSNVWKCVYQIVPRIRFIALFQCFEHFLTKRFDFMLRNLFSSPSFFSRFRFQSEGLVVDVGLNDKMDIICPQRPTNTSTDGHHYFKLFLVDAENYEKCEVAGGRRILTCNVPDREKKYTFYFQELSPLPWGLEFKSNHSYYVICKYMLVILIILFINAQRKPFAEG